MIKSQESLYRIPDVLHIDVGDIFPLQMWIIRSFVFFAWLWT